MPAEDFSRRVFGRYHLTTLTISLALVTYSAHQASGQSLPYTSTPTVSQQSCKGNWTGRTLERNGLGCLNLEDVTAPPGCTGPGKQAIQLFDKPHDMKTSVVVRVTPALSSVVASGFLLNFQIKVNGMEKHCGCYNVPPNIYSPANPIVISDAPFQQCVMAFSGPNATFQRQLYGNITTLPIEAGNKSNVERQTTVLPPLRLYSCVAANCFPSPCFTRCVPLPPAVKLVRLDRSTLQFRLLSQPKFPVEHVSVRFTSIVVVLSAKDTHEVLYNITYPADVDTHNITVPDYLKYTSMSLEASVSCLRIIGANITYSLVGDTAVYDFDVVNGTWMSWQNTSCSATCGQGTAIQVRHCSPPMNGGTNCAGNDERIVNCVVRPCPGYTWGVWTTNGSCQHGCRQEFSRVCLSNTGAVSNTSHCGMRSTERRHCALCDISNKLKVYLPVAAAAFFACLAAIAVVSHLIRKRCLRQGYQIQLTMDDDDSPVPSHSLWDFTNSLTPDILWETGNPKRPVCYYVSHDRSSPLAQQLGRYLADIGCNTALDIYDIVNINNRSKYEHPEKWLHETLNWTSGAFSRHRETACSCNKGIGGCPHLPNYLLFLCTPDLKRLYDDVLPHLSDERNEEDFNGTYNGHPSFLRAERAIAEKHRGNVVAVVVAGETTYKEHVPNFLRAMKCDIVACPVLERVAYINADGRPVSQL